MSALLYLLDANVLIDADRDYYPLDRIPDFWEWLLMNAEEGKVKVPREIYDEVMRGKKGQLTAWMRSNRKVLRFAESPNPSVLKRVVRQGYAPDLDDAEMDRIGKDPFLISYAVSDRHNRAVVTTESARPSKRRANRHIPDVCDTLGVRHCHTFKLIKKLDFRI